jgi:hypothetical protein
MATSVAWTDAGRAALVEERGRHIPIVDGDVAAKVKALFKVHVPAWKRGLDDCDDAGRVFAKLAIAWKPNGVPKIDQLAAVLSLSYACDNEEKVWPWFAEWILREYGIEVAMRVLIAMWPMVVSYKGKLRRAFVAVRGPDDPYIFDISICRGKGYFADYIAARELPGRAEAIAKLWPTTPRCAKPALAVAGRDSDRGIEISKELSKQDKQHAWYAWAELPHLIRDAKVVTKILGSHGATFRMIDNLGVKVLPILERQFAGARDKYSRKRAMELLVNLKSPEVARLLAEYVGQKPYDELVAAYFAQHPALLEPLLYDEELQYHRDDLLKLNAR